MTDDINNPRFNKREYLGYIAISGSDIDKLINNLQNIKSENSEYLEIKYEISDGFEGTTLSFHGTRLESDEEYESRLKNIRKHQEKKSKRESERFNRELKTIKTLMKKHKITNIDLDKEND